MEGKVILITGGAGFIGTNFVKMLSERFSDSEIIVIDLLTYAGNIENIKDLIDSEQIKFIKCDISDSQKIFDIFNQHSPDYVINFAAESHVDRSILNSRKFIETNVLGTQTLLEAARQQWKIANGFKNNVMYLQISTDEVYGSIQKGYFTEKSPLDPHSPYSASKASADLLVKSYFDTYGFPAVITRCSNNYGPYQFPEKLIPLIISNITSGKKLPIYGDGKNIRDWIHVSDHCNAIVEISNKSKSGEIYNIGANNEWKNIDLVKLLIRIVRAEIEKNDSFKKYSKICPSKISEDLIEFVKDRPGHDKRYAIDSTKIKKVIGWKPNISFEIGLRDTIRWYLSNQQWIKKIVSGEYKNYYKQMYENRGGLK
jgi:dTDP-glucose 4,6-dehydratase